MVFTSPGSGGLIAICAVFQAMVMSAVGLRFRARWKDKVAYGADDWCVLAALIVYTAIYTVPVIVACAAGGLGSHLQLLPDGSHAEANLTFKNTHFVYIGFGPVVLGLGRCSILLLYNRIFLGKTFKIVVWTLIVYNIVWTLAFFFAFLFKCGTPSTAIVGTGHCIDLWAYLKALGVTSVLSDFLILLVPWPLVYQLQMQQIQKVAVSIIFLLGNLTLVASILRCVVLFEVDVLLEAGLTDFTWTDSINLVWFLVESMMVIVCSCLPTLGRYLWRKFPSKLQSVTTRMRSMRKHYKSDPMSRSSPTAGDETSLDPLEAGHFDHYNGSDKSYLPMDVISPGRIGVRHEFEVTSESAAHV